MIVARWPIAALVASPLLTACLLATGVAEEPKPGGEAGQPAATPTSQEKSPTLETPSQTEPKLSPAETEFRDRLRRVLAFYLANQTFNTRENTPRDVLLFCLAFGADAQVAYDGPSGAKVNAIGSLCWNTPCAGYTLLQIGDDRIMARVGYGLQEKTSQFLATLAQSRVPGDYEIRIGKQRRTVADLAESEKRSCGDGNDLSMTLVALSHYLPAYATWKDAGGESWSLERLVQTELDREVSQADAGATDRLMGLSYAIDRRARHEQPMEGQYARAQKHVTDYQDFALRIVNADGSWNPRFFAVRGTSSDAAGTLRATGHILEWLVFSLPEERLKEPPVVKSVAYVAGLLEGWQQTVNTAALSPRLLDATMRAVHAILMYDQRVFKPHDPKDLKDPKKV